jgi:hypothetical protein
VRPARLAPAMISTPGHWASRRRQCGALPAWSLFGSSRPVPGDEVLQVVDMRDTAIVGHVNFAIEPAALLPALWQGVLYRTTTAKGGPVTLSAARRQHPLRVPIHHQAFVPDRPLGPRCTGSMLPISTGWVVKESGSHPTCMGLFLSSGCFGFAVSSLFGAGRPFFVPSPAIRFAERAEGVKGPKR